MLPEGWENVDGVEDTAEVNQGKKDESVEGADVVKLFRDDGNDCTEGRKEGGRGDGDHEHEERVDGNDDFKGERNKPGDHADH